MKIIEVDLNREEAQKSYENYKDHPLQPQGYNIFIHNPPNNPENRLVRLSDGSFQKVMIEDDQEPLEWLEEEFNKTWCWAVDDVWGWIDIEGEMYHVNFSTVGHKMEKLRSVRRYFQDLQKQDLNIYEDPKFAKFLPENLSYIEMYQKEMKHVEEQLKDLQVGYIKRDPEHPDLIIEVCIPEEDLSNSVLEKWRGTICDFIKSPLERLNFSQGKISPTRTINKL